MWFPLRCGMTIHASRRRQRQQPFVAGRIDLDADDSSTFSTITDIPQQNANTQQFKINDSSSYHCSSNDPRSTTSTSSTEPPAAPQPKKSVRFDEGQTIAYENALICREECLDLWYTALECSEFKASTVKHAKEIIRSEKRPNSTDPLCYQRTMRRTYHACCQRQVVVGDNCSSSSSTEDNDAVVLTELEMHKLQQWLAFCCEHDRIGMEKLTIRSIAKDRRYRRLEAMTIIFEIQEQMQIKSSGDNDRKAEFIRKACQILSRPARSFAQVLALAQYNASAS